MAFIASCSETEPRGWSLGTLKLQVLTYTASSGDTSGTLLACSVSRIMHIFSDGSLRLTSAPVISGSTATIAFANPGATRVGTILIIGK